MSDESLKRIAEALERLAPAPAAAPDFAAAEAFVWHVAPDRLEPVGKVARVGLPLLVGIDRARDILLANTRQFAKGHPANNALLWGARGMGKSSLVKAIHAEVLGEGLALKIVELSREDLPTVSRLLAHLRGAPECRFILFFNKGNIAIFHGIAHHFLGLFPEFGVVYVLFTKTFLAVLRQAHDIIINPEDSEILDVHVNHTHEFALKLLFSTVNMGVIHLHATNSHKAHQCP